MNGGCLNDSCAPFRRLFCKDDKEMENNETVEDETVKRLRKKYSTDPRSVNLVYSDKGSGLLDLEVEYKDTLLSVSLLKAKGLKRKDFFSLSDPYAKVYLLREEWEGKKNYENTVRSPRKNYRNPHENTLHPDFSDTYNFEGIPDIENYLLVVSIWDSDWGHSAGCCCCGLCKDSYMAGVRIPLKIFCVNSQTEATNKFKKFFTVKLQKLYADGHPLKVREKDLISLQDCREDSSDQEMIPELNDSPKVNEMNVNIIVEQPTRMRSPTSQNSIRMQNHASVVDELQAKQGFQPTARYNDGYENEYAEPVSVAHAYHTDDSIYEEKSKKKKKKKDPKRESHEPVYKEIKEKQRELDRLNVSGYNRPHQGNSYETDVTDPIQQAHGDLYVQELPHKTPVEWQRTYSTLSDDYTGDKKKEKKRSRNDSYNKSIQNRMNQQQLPDESDLVPQLPGGGQMSQIPDVHGHQVPDHEIFYDVDLDPSGRRIVNEQVVTQTEYAEYIIKDSEGETII